MSMDRLQAVADEALAALGRAKVIVDAANAGDAAKDAQIADLQAQVAAGEDEAISIVQPVADAANALAPPPPPPVEPAP